MKFIKSFFSALAILGMAAHLTAQEAAPAAETTPAAPEAAAAPAQPSLDELLAFVPEVVATKNGAPALLREQFVKEIKPALEGALMQGVPVTAEMVQGFAYQVAESIVMRGVLVSAAQAAGFKADEDAAKKLLENMKQQAEQQQEGMFAAQLAQLGMSEDDVLVRIKEQQVIQQLQESFAAKVEKPAPTTEEEAKAFYEENIDQMRTPKLLSASHILVQFPSQAPTEDEKAAALKKARDIRAGLAEDGSNFAETAAAQSDCPSKQKGGDLGQFPIGSMVPEFERALLGLAEGEISAPVETIFGYHIIKAGATQEEKLTPFEEIKDRIIAYLDNTKGEEAVSQAVNAAMETLMKGAAIEVLLPKPAMDEPEADETAEETAPTPAE